MTSTVHRLPLLPRKRRFNRIHKTNNKIKTDYTINTNGCSQQLLTQGINAFSISVRKYNSPWHDNSSLQLLYILTSLYRLSPGPFHYPSFTRTCYRPFTIMAQGIFKESFQDFLIFIIRTIMKLHLRDTEAKQNLGWKRLLITSYFQQIRKTSNSGFLLCDAVSLDKYLLMFRRIVVPSYSGSGSARSPFETSKTTHPTT
jgi:hypothetical protein